MIKVTKLIEKKSQIENILIKKCHTFNMSAGSMYHVNIDAKKIPLFISVWVGYWIRKNNLDSNKHEYPMDKQEQITCLAWPVGTPQDVIH